MRRKRYWVRMHMLEGTESWVTKCEHIGEAKLFSYILSTFNRTDATWANTKIRRQAVEQLFGLKEASVFSYLKHLTAVGLLVKMGRGEYKVNEEYISYGGK